MSEDTNKRQMINRQKQYKMQLIVHKKKNSVVYFSSGRFESYNSIYRIVFIQLPNQIWYIKAPFIKMMLENAFGGNEVPYWVSSLREIFIRKQPHGPNQLDRTKKTSGEWSYPKSMVAFTHKISRAASLFERHSLSYAIAKIHNIFANNTNRLNEALHSWLCENQRGVIRYFTEKFNQKALLDKFKNDVNKIFKAKRVVKSNIPLDMFMLDWDIKNFIQKDIGLKCWPKDKLPIIYGRFNNGNGKVEFNEIQKHSIK